MLNISGPTGDMGVIVARFQTPYLTEGHRELIETVRSRHAKFAIVLGISPVIPSRNNPLDFSTRLGMLMDAYPDVEVYPQRDNRSDKIWSQNLDTMLRTTHPHEKIVLYGSRDSFLKHYTGRMACAELDEIHGINATTARIEAFHSVKASEDFRRGICYAVANAYRKNVLAVDVAVIDQGTRRVLLGRKNEDDHKWRFIGGHVNVGTESGEQCGRREVAEETGAEVGLMEYICSTPIVADWRYRGLPDCMFSIFFAGHYIPSPIKASDDIDDVKWFDFKHIDENMMVSEHHVLTDQFLRFVGMRSMREATEPNGDIKKYSYVNYGGIEMITSPVPAKYVKLPGQE